MKDYKVDENGEVTITKPLFLIKVRYKDEVVQTFQNCTDLVWNKYSLSFATYSLVNKQVRLNQTITISIDKCFSIEITRNE